MIFSLALIPVVGLLLMIYFNDKKEKEPFGLLIAIFFAGVGSVIPALILEKLGGMVIGTDSMIEGILHAMIVVGPAEELSKFLVLFLITWKNKNFNYSYDAIVYAVFASLGFAAIENINYTLFFGAGTALLRMFTSIPGHACFGVYMGFFYSRAKYAKLTKKKNLVGLLPSISALPSTIVGSSPIVMGTGILAQASSFVLAPDTKVTTWDDFLAAVQSMEGHYSTGDSLAYYNSLLDIAERLAVPDVMEPNPMPVEEKAEYEKPFTLGLSASIGLNDRWSVLTGLEYTRLRSSHTIGRDTLYLKNRQTVHYVGVPLGLSYTVWSKGNMHLNASAFGKMEIPIAGILNSEHQNGVAYTYQNTLKFKAPIQWSAGAGIGLQYNLTPWMGLYVEPQVRYYFDTGGIQTIRQVQPVEFAVPFGVRLTF